MSRKSTGPSLVAFGLLGMAGYDIVLHLFHPQVLASDMVNGLWFGVCIGLAILGLFVLGKAKHRDAA